MNIQVYRSNAGLPDHPRGQILSFDPDRVAPAPRVHDAVAMMLFLSANGCRRRAAFEHARLPVGGDSW